VEQRRELGLLKASELAHGVKGLRADARVILQQSQTWKKMFMGFLIFTLPVLGWITERVVTLPETYIVKEELKEVKTDIVKRLDRIDDTLVFIIQEIGKSR